MPDAPVSLDEILATVTRMEARLSALQDPAVRHLWQLYRQQLVPRFDADLQASARDVALAKASALMLVQAVAQDAVGAPMQTPPATIPKAT